MLGLALLMVACGSDDASNDPAKGDGGVGDGSSGALSVAVVYGGKSVAVDLAKPKPVTLSGGSYARMSDLLSLGLPGKPASGLTVDFEAADGFRPAKSPNCKGVTPVAATTLDKGFVHLTSRNIRWDDSLGLPGCMGLRDMAKLIIADK